MKRKNTIICKYCSKELQFYSSNKDLFSNKEFDIYFCSHCLIGQTNLTEKFDLAAYYPSNYYGESGKKFNLLLEFFVLRKVQYFRSMFCYRLFKSKNVKLLDIGCGTGNFIYFMHKMGWAVYGTEISSKNVSIARKKVGIDSIFINNDINDVKNINFNFNLITLWHVLEHLEEPEKIINIIEEKLIDKGYLVIEVPNLDSFQYLIDKKNWIHLECPRHITHFTIQGLYTFFKHKKFKFVKSSTLSLEFGFFGMLQSLLNLFVPIPNFLFLMMRNKFAPINSSSRSLITRYISFFLTIVLIMPLSIAAIIFEFIAILFKKGGCIRVVIQKTE